jgi:SAM-dependent methyltransferase
MKNRFSSRSDQKELLDELNIPKQLLHKNLRELDILNRATGGHAISLKGIGQLINDRDRVYEIVDLGCGSGDSLKAIANWARKHKFKVSLTGVDMNADAISYLNRHCSQYPEISGFTGDYLDYMNQVKTVDIVLCSLFCHHLNDTEILSLFECFKDKAKVGFVINDLKRNRMAYYSAWLFTRIFNGTKLARNDGPVSVLRGFQYKELDKLLSQSGLDSYTISEEWIFRFLIVGKTDKYESGR